jgi:hypothetical protein
VEMARRRLFVRADRMYKKPKPGRKKLVKWPKKLLYEQVSQCSTLLPTLLCDRVAVCLHSAEGACMVLLPAPPVPKLGRRLLLLLDVRPAHLTLAVAGVRAAGGDCLWAVPIPPGPVLHQGSPSFRFSENAQAHLHSHTVLCDSCVTVCIRFRWCTSACHYWASFSGFSLVSNPTMAACLAERNAGIDCVERKQAQAVPYMSYLDR